MLRLAELITEPCALPAAAVFRSTPYIPTTPWAAELSAPLAATPAVRFTAPLTAPVEFVTAPAVLPTAPAVEFTVPPAAVVTEPSGPPPLLRPPPTELPLP